MILFGVQEVEGSVGKIENLYQLYRLEGGLRSVIFSFIKLILGNVLRSRNESHGTLILGSKGNKSWERSLLVLKHPWANREAIKVLQRKNRLREGNQTLSNLLESEKMAMRVKMPNQEIKFH